MDDKKEYTKEELQKTINEINNIINESKKYGHDHKIQIAENSAEEWQKTIAAKMIGMSPDELQKTLTKQILPDNYISSDI